MSDNDNHYRYVEGGMGAVSSAIEKAAKEAGAHIITSAEVSLFRNTLPGFIV